MHIPEIMKNEKFNLIAVVDPLEDRLHEAGKIPGVKGYSSCEKLFRNEKPDLVVIASPTHLHKEHANMAFKNGSEVHCDKPIAVSLEETDFIIR